MSEAMVIRCCAPTLAALKTGSLFNCPFESSEAMHEDLREMNQHMILKGVCAIPLKFQNGRALIYLYRPEMLEHDLQDPVAERILKDCGYPRAEASLRITHLIKRLKESETFPHEIGLFLGYPPVDVRGFIEHRECKLTGVWKVYESDPEQARKIFRQCHHCTEVYVRRNREGWSLSRLTIKRTNHAYHKTHVR